MQKKNLFLVEVFIKDLFSVPEVHAKHVANSAVNSSTKGSFRESFI